MSTIIYERRTGSGEIETHKIDELSQRLLVYLLINGSSTVDAIQEPVGATSKEEIETRHENTLGPDAAGLTELKPGNQTLDGGVPKEYTLTDSGKTFVYTHKDSLSMPADLTEIAQRVSRLQLWLDELDQRVKNIERQVEE